MYSNTDPHKLRCQFTNLTLQLKLEKEQKEHPKTSKRQETIKIKTEIQKTKE